MPIKLDHRFDDVSVGRLKGNKDPRRMQLSEIFH